MKDSFYFPHDYNARGDENIIKLLRSMGWSGYGLYWAIVEKMYEACGTIALDYENLSFDLRIDVSQLKKLVSEFGLFYSKGCRIGSHSVNRRLKERLEKSDKARQSALAKNIRANAKRTLSERSPNGVLERKERKERKEIKENKEILCAASPPAIAEARKTTPIQKVIRAYKIVKGVERDNKDWDRANFGRSAPYAKGILDAFKGNLESAVAFIITQGNEWTKAGLSDWTLAAIQEQAFNKAPSMMAQEKINGMERLPESLGDSEICGPAEPERIAHRGKPIIESAGSILAAGVGEILRPRDGQV